MDHVISFIIVIIIKYNPGSSVVTKEIKLGNRFILVSSDIVLPIGLWIVTSKIFKL